MNNQEERNQLSQYSLRLSMVAHDESGAESLQVEQGFVALGSADFRSGTQRLAG